MNGSIKLAGMVAALLSQCCLAQDFLNFSAVLRVDDGAPHVIQSDVELDSTRLLRIDDNYLIEFAAPAALSDDAIASIRLFGLEDAEYKVLHTSRQDLLDLKTRHVGYRLCSGKLTFVSPSPEFPADCMSGN